MDRSARPADEIESMMHTYGDMLFRLCLLILGNACDAEDVIQETMIKYLQKASQYHFKDEEHKKAWLIKVATNGSKDVLRYRNRHPVVDVDEIKGYMQEKEDSGIIGKTTSAVKMRLQKGRELLKESYRKECM